MLYDTHHTIRDSRGANVPKNVLPDWKGTIVCNGWGSYSSFKIRRCWAHIIRWTKTINYRYNAPTTNHMETEPNAIMLKGVNAKGDKKCREKLVKQLQKETRNLAERHRENWRFGEFVKKSNNTIPDMFRFVIDQTILPTNNAAEHGSA